MPPAQPPINSHNDLIGPAPWIARFEPLIGPDGPVLDLACGNGRHTRFLLQQDHPVVAVDRDVSGLADLTTRDDLEIVMADLEGAPWPFAGQQFAAIVVVYYLHRPLLPLLAGALAPGGVLIYQTFAAGNERFGKPSNPNFLLRPNELLDAFAPSFDVVAFEQGEVSQPKPSIIQRICVVKRGGAATRPPVLPP